MWLSFKDFEEDLQYSIDHPYAEPRNPDGDITPFGDTVAELSEWDGFKPKMKGSAKLNLKPSNSFGMPHREPLRNVGRNDPCPCGSGKKFKKCCLNSDFDPLSEGVPPWEAAPILRNSVTT